MLTCRRSERTRLGSLRWDETNSLVTQTTPTNLATPTTTPTSMTTPTPGSYIVANEHIDYKQLYERERREKEVRNAILQANTRTVIDPGEK